MIRAKRLKEALAAISLAKADAEQVLREEFPVGWRVSWDCGHRSMGADGSVIEHGHGLRLKVHNDYTGRDYWITADKIFGDGSP
jgi:hypothetical protein